MTPTPVTLPIGSTQPFHSTATFADQSTLDVTTLTTWTSAAPGTVSVTTAGVAQGVALGTTTITGTLGSVNGAGQVQVITATGQPLPPDPSTVATPINQTVATTLANTTAFLYTGANPIQTGVATGTIQTQRAAVLRGKVSTRDGFPLPGVTVTVLNHPEFGQTLTRPDGMFDLAVNGGGPLTVTYRKSGFLPAQRQVDVPWQHVLAVHDVVMIPLDPQVTTIAANAPTMQAAQGSVVTDAEGTRRATLLFPAGTTATMTLPGGGTQPLTSLNVRATEYTIGTTGPRTMPAELPPTSDYTYAVEYSVDEAITAGATTVQFNQPVISYLENFLAFPVGAAVPLGFYDAQQGTWVPSDSGKVIKILSVTGGLAEVDTTGSGSPDNTGLSTAERQQVAGLYQPGQSLWRMAITHFSSWDPNYKIFPPNDAVFPGQRDPQVTASTTNDPCSQTGSTIECENQTLRESVPLIGTPVQLSYASSRAPGRLGNHRLLVPLSGPSLPASLKRIDLEMDVAGRQVVQSFATTPNQTTTVTWDGLDAYGRRPQGSQLVNTRLNYVYDGVYQLVPRFSASTGNITGIRGRRELNLVQFWQGTLGIWDARGLGLGGWSLTLHHAYDPVGRTLYLGTGAQRSTEGLPAVVTTIAGNGIAAFSGDGGPAAAAQLNFPYATVQAPDGTLFVTDTTNSRIRRIAPDGTISTVAGNGTAGSSGDGGPATAAQLNFPIGLAVSPDGSLYIADFSNHRVRRVAPNGIITTAAGTGVVGFGGDGGPAIAAQLNRPFGVAVAPDGSLYISESGVFPSNGTGHRVRRVGPDGLITTVAGTGTWGFNGDGAATARNLSTPTGIALGPDGSLYIADSQAHRIRRVSTNGVMTTVAGSVSFADYGGDGGPATAARLSFPQDVKAASDGTLYIADAFNQRIRRVTPDGIITTIAGNGAFGFGGDGGPGPAATLSEPRGIGIGLADDLYLADHQGHRIRRLAPQFPGLALGDVVIPAEDGTELYVFNNQGRHLRTVDALTGANRYVFAYNAAELLTSITDADNKMTTIQRNANGNPTAIVAPGGQQTTLTLEGNGYLQSITNPNNEKVELTYSAEGLLATLKDARGNLHRNTYDANGRLIKDQDPAGGFKALSRTEQSTGWTVALSTVLNRTTTYQVENLPIGDLRRKVTEPSGLLTTTLIKSNGSRTITAPDGTITTPTEGPDPRWGMQAPILKSLTVQTPLGLTSNLTSTRAVTLSNPNDPLSLATQTDTLVINGRSYTSTYTQATRLLSTTTPQCRASQVTLDAKGRVVQEQVTGLEAVSYTYDSLGRLSTITQGTGGTARTSTLTYNSKNELTNIQDPLLRNVGFLYDLAGRIMTQVLPDTRQIGYAYDGNGNVTSITPPPGPAHLFAYTSVDLESNYTPPDAGFSPRNTTYAYNLDRQLTLVTRPDGQTIQLGYEPTGGRLSNLTLPGSVTINYAYSPTAGTLSSITAPGSTLSYAYDGSLLKQTTWAGAIAGSVSRNYDNNFRITSQSVN
ncbi:MAG: NHL domain-containing protein, partial [Nitrospiraceae bacterium]